MASRTVLIVVLCLGFLPACEGEKSRAPIATAQATLPEKFVKGEQAYDKYCAGCHGTNARGTDHGPSFIDKIYEPNHHGDLAFMTAPRMGARAHHWNFGDMPKISGVSDDELKQITGYIRWLQRNAGIQ